MTSTSDLLGMPVDAWVNGKREAVRQAIPAVGSDAHILAASAGPPWLEPQFPPRRTTRRVTLHGGRYDDCRLDVWSLGQTLTVGGEHGRAVYEMKEHDDQTAIYVAVDEPCDVPAVIDDPPPVLEAAAEREHLEALF